MCLDRQYHYTLRRIDESKEFQKQCREFVKEYPRFGKILIEIRRDLQGFAHDNPNNYQDYYWKDTIPTMGLPGFSYTYKYDDSCVYLLEIWEANDELG